MSVLQIGNGLGEGNSGAVFRKIPNPKGKTGRRYGAAYGQTDTGVRFPTGMNFE